MAIIEAREVGLDGTVSLLGMTGLVMHCCLWEGLDQPTNHSAPRILSSWAAGPGRT